MIVNCPACNTPVKVYVNIKVMEDVLDEKHAPIIIATAKYNPMRRHWELAGHDKSSYPRE